MANTHAGNAHRGECCRLVQTRRAGSCSDEQCRPKKTQPLRTVPEWLSAERSWEWRLWEWRHKCQSEQCLKVKAHTFRQSMLWPGRAPFTPIMQHTSNVGRVVRALRTPARDSTFVVYEESYAGVEISAHLPWAPTYCIPKCNPNRAGRRLCIHATGEPRCRLRDGREDSNTNPHSQENGGKRPALRAPQQSNRQKTTPKKRSMKTNHSGEG